MAAPNNVYTSQTISGFNASPPPDDGTTTSDNKLAWSKHIDKIGTPLKNLAEGINSAISSAFGSLIVTDDPGQEGLVISARMFN